MNKEQKIFEKVIKKRRKKAQKIWWLKNIGNKSKLIKKPIERIEKISLGQRFILFLKRVFKR